MIQPIRVVETGRTCVWGVRLHPWAASVVAGMPAYELTGRIERTEDVCPRLARDLADALDSADQDGADADLAWGVQALDRVLGWHLARAVPLDPLVVAAGGLLLRQPRPIAEMAARLGVSVRRLERAFQHTVGLTPKMFARISRFQRVAAILDGAPEEAPANRLASVALECGYYDQSHLVRDVRAFAGDTPVALRDALDGELAEYFLRARRASHFSKIDPLHVD
jgi:AraC-like DNA-binding protein